MTAAEPFDRFVVISGCSAGGKSTLLAEIARRGYATVEEPGRRIVKEQLKRGGSALPWIDREAFCAAAFAQALEDRAQAAGLAGWIFFDRSLIDAAAGLERATGEPVANILRPSHRYHQRVFIAPPWPEIHSADAHRRHGLEEALIEHQHLLTVFPALGYTLMLLPKVSVAARADFVLQTLDE